LTVVLLIVFVLSLALSFVLTRTVRDTANVRGWVAPLTHEGHLHAGPLPRLGGVAIFTSFSVSVAVAVLLARSHWGGLAAMLPWKTLVTILAPGALVFLLGVYDDLYSVGPYWKFAVQAAAGSMLFFGGLRILNIPVLFGSHHLPWFLGLPTTIIWVLAITNAFNLIDGMDGLAAGSALFSTLVAFVVALVSGNVLVTLVAIALAGAILGFLRFNFNPATIFLGDSGSLFIGFILSAVAIEGAQKAPTIVAVAIPIVSFGLPILETSLSIVRRLISGRPVFTADREHIHHKLLQRGFTHKQAVIVLYAVSAIFAMLSLFLLWPTGSSLGLVLAVVGIGIWIGVQRLGYLEFGEIARVAQRTLEQPHIFVNNLAIRRAIEELKVTRDYPQICRILEAAFACNDFDAFDLRVKLLPGELAPDEAELVSPRRTELMRHWNRNDAQRSPDNLAAWSVALDLVSELNRRRGTLVLHRLYSQRDLQLDMNLLTSVFPVALADALDRSLQHTMQIVALPERQAGFNEAQAG
jgi:UDP-GlcNAc:undecaprenyl-phosphate/decaprenyl-phosphate GlcNAc-1-phosphate transferase